MAVDNVKLKTNGLCRSLINKNNGFGSYLAIFLGEMVDLGGDLIADGLGNSFTINYVGFVIRWRCHFLEEIRWVGVRDLGVGEGYDAIYSVSFCSAKSYNSAGQGRSMYLGLKAKR